MEFSDGLKSRTVTAVPAGLRFRPRYRLAVLFYKTLDGMIEQIEHDFRRSTKPGALRRHHDRPVDQDRMRQHEIEQLVVAPFRVGQSHFGVRRTLFAQQGADGNSRRLDQFDQPRAARRVFEIFDTSRSSPLCRIMASVLREVPQEGL